jgi:hypothetical protein
LFAPLEKIEKDTNAAALTSLCTHSDNEAIAQDRSHLIHVSSKQFLLRVVRRAQAREIECLSARFYDAVATEFADEADAHKKRFDLS